MKIQMLVENTRISSEFKKKHGLSIYIESLADKIIFDVGPNDLFLKNAAQLGVDIKAINIAVISHGHADHGGGLSAFINNNTSAKIFTHKLSFEPHYTDIIFGLKYYVGLDRSLKDCKQIIQTKELFQINSCIQLFSDVPYEINTNSINDSLYIKNNGKYANDTFLDEQNMIISENGKNVLVTGCAHSGILSIIEKAESIIGQELDYVIGGFHLFNPITKKVKSEKNLDLIAQQLMKRRSQYYTCHCTGEKAFEYLQEQMGDKIHYFSTGETIEI